MIRTIDIGEPYKDSNTVPIYQRIEEENGDRILVNRLQVPITAQFEIWKSPYTKEWYFTIDYEQTKIMLDLDIDNYTDNFYTTYWGE